MVDVSSGNRAPDPGPIIRAPLSKLAIGVAAGWTCVLSAAFSYGFAHPDIGEAAGWLIVVYVLQVPAYVAMVTAPRGRAFGTGRALSVALPAGLVIAEELTWLAASGGTNLHYSEFEMRLVVFTVLIGGVTLLVAGALLTWILRHWPHPRGCTGALAAVTVAAAPLVQSVVFGAGVRGAEPGFWILALAPCAFVAPLWLVVRAHPAEPPPVPAARALDG